MATSSHEKLPKISKAYLLGYSKEPFKQQKPPPPPPPPRGGFVNVLSTPGAMVEWVASDGRKGRASGPRQIALARALLTADNLAKVPSVAQANKVETAADPALPAPVPPVEPAAAPAAENNAGSIGGVFGGMFDPDPAPANNNKGWTKEQDGELIRRKTENETWADIGEAMVKDKDALVARWKDVRPADWKPTPQEKGKGKNKNKGAKGKKGEERKAEEPGGGGGGGGWNNAGGNDAAGGGDNAGWGGLGGMSDTAAWGNTAIDNTGASNTGNDHAVAWNAGTGGNTGGVTNGGRWNAGGGNDTSGNTGGDATGGGGWNTGSGNNPGGGGWNNDTKSGNGNQNPGNGGAWNSNANASAKHSSKFNGNRNNHHFDRNGNNGRKGSSISTISPDDHFSLSDLALVAKLTSRDSRDYWFRISNAFRDKTGKHIDPEVFKEKFGKKGM